MNIPLNSVIAFLLCLFMTMLSSCNMNTSSKKYSELTDQDYKHESDTVDGDTIHFKTVTTANEPQKITNLNDDQKLFVRKCLLGADSLVRIHLSSKNIIDLTPTSLDEIIDKWNEDSSKFDCSKEHFVNCIGAAFGDYLVRTYDMEWKIITDEYGSDYATTIEKYKLTNFPLNSVLKAVDQKREGSLTTISLVTKRDILKLDKEK